MTKDQVRSTEEALKLALEYLKLQKQYGPAIAYGNTTIDDCITAIKKARVVEFVDDLTKQPARSAWVGLTDEERDDLLDNYITAEGRARAIEAKLKEKNT